MAKKRGGLAGVYDRNKGWLRYVAPAAVGAIPGLGPLAAAGLGAAMRGFDRPGQRGIGFDLSEGVRGGLEGYSLGKLGKGARVGIGKMFAPRGAPISNIAAMPQVAPNVALDMPAFPGMPSPTGVGAAAAGAAAPAMAAPATAMPAAIPTAAAQTAPAAARTAAQTARTVADTTVPKGSLRAKAAEAIRFANENEKVFGGIARGVQGSLPSQSDIVEQERLKMDQQKYADELRREQEAQERYAALARLLMPYFAQSLGIPPGAPAMMDRR